MWLIGQNKNYYGALSTILQQYHQKNIITTQTVFLRRDAKGRKSLRVEVKEEYDNE